MISAGRTYGLDGLRYVKEGDPRLKRQDGESGEERLKRLKKVGVEELNKRHKKKLTKFAKEHKKSGYSDDFYKSPYLESDRSPADYGAICKGVKVNKLLTENTDPQIKALIDKEILTVDNHTDAPYIYQRIRERQPDRAAEVLELLRWNGGNSSGIGIASVDHRGEVHADQFWQHYSFGNVRERPFGDIWTDTSNALMAGLKDRKKLLKGRCAECQYLDVCNGNFRVRAEAVHDDVWAPDPACYLTDEEIKS